jgi:hypothetical protein
MKVELGQGAYTARSLAANAQRCVNLYVEPNPPDSPFPTTHYLAPGLKLKAAAPNNQPYRCLYRSKSTGELFSVNGPIVYQIGADWSFTVLGTMASSSGIVSMCDNGFEILIVDGSANGYHIDLPTKAFTTVTDPNFYGGTRVDYADTYFVLNRPGTNNWYISLTNEATFNSLDIASKTGSQDMLRSVIAVSDNLLLLGDLTTELWYNSGASDFTYQKLQGVFIEHGLHATYSLAKYESTVFWLAQNNEGERIVLRFAGMADDRISTYALEAELKTYTVTSDAVGFCYQQGGHVFYHLNFPTEGKSWVWDDSSKLWHERQSLINGEWGRHLAHVAAYAFGENVCGDYSNGNLYVFDPETYTDNGNPILRLRSFPHLQGEGQMVVYKSFTADMDSGNAATLTETSTQSAIGGGDAIGLLLALTYAGSVTTSSTLTGPMVNLRWSDDRGHSWGDAVQLPMGSTGEYLTSLQWWGLGAARHRVFEISWAEDCETALNGAWVDV